MTVFISIRKQGDNFSADISDNPFRGGACRIFRFVGDALLWINEQTGSDTPENWPDFNTWDWSKDFHSWDFWPKATNLAPAIDRIADQRDRLLAALKEMVSAMWQHFEYSHDGEDFEYCQRAIDQAKAAIAYVERELK